MMSVTHPKEETAFDPTPLLSARIQRYAPGAIRRLLPLENLPGMISLIAGNPNPEVFPFEKITLSLKGSSKQIILTQEDGLADGLQYGLPGGNPDLVKWFEDFQCELHDINKGHEWTCCIGNGSQELLHRTFQVLTDPGDPVLIETPAYPGVVGFLQAEDYKLVQAKTDRHGLDTFELERLLSQWPKNQSPPKLLYTIPTGSNPTGRSCPERRKIEILRLAKRFNFMVLEDDAYYFLNFEGESNGKPRSYLSLDGFHFIGQAYARPGTEVARGESGSLEITGEAFFKGYCNNPEATAEAFTSDGWFRTGDNAYIDKDGQLHLDSRTKDMININGVKYLPHELDSALEQAEIPGTTASYFCCFATRNTSKADTEVVVVLYLPSYNESDDEARYEAQSSIIRTCSMHTHSRPMVIPLRVEDMPKSTLGKLLRTKLKASLEEGKFADQKAANDEAVARYRQKIRGQPETIKEAAILYIIGQQLEMGFEDDFSVNDSIFSTGATSMDLVAIMQRLNGFLRASCHEKLIRLTDILKNPTARGIASRVAVSTGKKKHEYDPVVTLQPHGTKTPLWLVHPGVGEVLVFVNLAHHITDRPIHAFRARGFNAAEGETPFNSLEVFETYRAAIKKRQPHGPYAIAGYSFGGMVAFEVTKLLEAGGDEVRLCGSWNLPPHIKFRMRELLWDECVIHLFYFVGLMDEATAYTHKPALCAFEREGRRLGTIRYLKMYSDPARWDELGLDEEYYLLWVGLASNMQGLAVDYEPGGSVAAMDVFVADPLSHVAKNREDWIQNRLAAWKSFVRSEVRFHHVEGAHYTMLNPEYVVNFAKTLRKVLRERGL